MFLLCLVITAKRRTWLVQQVLLFLTLQILQCYASAVDSICESGWLRILEIQGQRVHLFLETADVSDQNFERLVDSCRAFQNLATEEIGRIAGQIPFSIRMATDHGRAILLRSTGDDVSESLISLGNCANRPAKHLARDVGRSGVPAGYLAFNRAALSDPDGDATWQLINLRADKAIKAATVEVELLESAKNRFGQMTSFAAKEFQPNPNNPVDAPVRRKGYMLRADLEGFSQAVKEALASGDSAILALVKTFQQIMKYLPLTGHG